MREVRITASSQPRAHPRIDLRPGHCPALLQTFTNELEHGPPCVPLLNAQPSAPPDTGDNGIALACFDVPGIHHLVPLFDEEIRGYPIAKASLLRICNRRTDQGWIGHVGLTE